MLVLAHNAGQPAPSALAVVARGCTVLLSSSVTSFILLAHDARLLAVPAFATIE